jgi:hypothetical protein
MTHRTVGFGRGFPRSWLLPIGALTILLGVAASGRLSRSIVADLIAWWPVWVGLGIAAVVFRDKKLGAYRVSGIVPLVALGFVLVFTWGHLAGWSIMPSSSQRLVGPNASSFTTAALTAEIDGRIHVGPDTDFLYQVEPLMQGGGIGIPRAEEQVVDTSVSIDLIEPEDPGLYVYAGWDLRLNPGAVWSLDLGGSLDADLTGLTINALDASGAGTIHLGTVTAATPVNIAGSFQVTVPSDFPARVIGTASVPASWNLTADGATAPFSGDGWVITVVGDTSLTVVER